MTSVAVEGSKTPGMEKESGRYQQRHHFTEKPEDFGARKKGVHGEDWATEQRHGSMRGRH